MATVNRYTQVQPAQFQARSLQETLMVPQYMREQHDNLDAGKAALEGELAKIDSLDFHSDAVNEKRNQIQQKLEGFGSKLASKGFDHSSKSDFMGIHKDYTSEMSSDGTFGKAQSIKQNFENEKKSIIETGLKLNHSEDDIQNNINAAYKKAENEYKQTKEMKNISMPGVPQKYGNEQFIDEARKILQNSGTSLEEFSAKGYQFIQDPATKAIMLQQGGKAVSTNNPQLAAVAELGKLHFATESGKGFKSDQFRNIRLEERLKKLNATIAGMSQHSEQDRRRTQLVQGLGKGQSPKEESQRAAFYSEDKTTSIAKNKSDLRSKIEKAKDIYSESQDPKDLAEVRALENVLEEAETLSHEFIKKEGLDLEKYNSVIEKIGKVDNKLVKPWQGLTKLGEEKYDSGTESIINNLALEDGWLTRTWKTGEGVSTAKFVKTDDGNYQLEINPSMGNKELMGNPISKEEHEFLKENHELLKKRDKFIDEKVSKTGYNRKQLGFDYTDTEFNNMSATIKRDINANNFVPSFIMGKDNNGEKIDIDENNETIKQQSIDLIKTNTLQNVTFSQVNSQSGMTLTVAMDSDLEIDGKDFKKGSTIEMFVPVEYSGDGNPINSVQNHFVNKVLNNNKSFKNQTKRMVKYSSLVPTSNKSKLGENNQYTVENYSPNLLNSKPGEVLDILKNNKIDSNGELVSKNSLYRIDENGDSEPVLLKELFGTDDVEEVISNQTRLKQIIDFIDANTGFGSYIFENMSSDELKNPDSDTQLKVLRRLLNKPVETSDSSNIYTILDIAQQD